MYKYTVLIALIIVLFVSFKEQHNTIQYDEIKGMELIKGGMFIMGIDSNRLKSYTTLFNVTPDIISQEYPHVKVSIASYYLDKYEVSNAQYKTFIEANPQWSKHNIPDSLHDGNYLKEWTGNEYPKGQANYPVVYVSWHAALAYANWQGKRLPTEAEWEYAANNNSPAPLFPWGNQSPNPKKQNFINSNIGHPVHVNQYKSNDYGIYHLADNVSEFVADQWWQDKYAEMNDVTGKKYTSHSEPNNIVVRGGNYNSPPAELRTTYRHKHNRTECSGLIGFRCAKSTSKLNRP